MKSLVQDILALKRLHSAAGIAPVYARLAMGGVWRALCTVLKVYNHYESAR
jgi:hypothetical protein